MIIKIKLPVPTATPRVVTDDQQCRRTSDSVVALDYVARGLRISNAEFAHIRDVESQSLLARRKLCLVLDLDHTLLHTTRIHALSPSEEYLKDSDSVFKWEAKGMLTKLRPNVHNFLQEASHLFEMYIYTMGDREYALQMAKLLDPHNVYFNSRVISREDCTRKNHKGLDIVPVHENSVLILDDKRSVWSRHKGNLIRVKKYNYFSSKGSKESAGLTSYTSFSEQRSDESVTSGALSSVLQVLKRVHGLFYATFEDQRSDESDVRQLLKITQKELLKGCKLVLGEGVQSGKKGRSQLWRMAEDMGATCMGEYGDSLATHVVSMDSSTAEARWALMENKLLVSPEWIKSTYRLWKRQPEEGFSLTRKDNVSAAGNGNVKKRRLRIIFSSDSGNGKRLRSCSELPSQGSGIMQSCC